MPLADSIQSENYQSGRSFKFYIKSVDQTAKGPEVVVARNHPEILRKLFKLEVPEIASGAVQIKSIAREAGSRSKIAVVAKEEAIDPIGSCVGQRGTRVQTIINEVGGEKIDIIEWDENIAKFIAKALSPAKVNKVDVKGDKNIKMKKQKNDGEQTQGGEKNDYKTRETSTEREAIVYVNEDQLSLAIGKAGQNVRLAAKLTGWRIDIVADNATGKANETDTGEKDNVADSNDSASKLKNKTDDK